MWRVWLSYNLSLKIKAAINENTYLGIAQNVNIPTPIPRANTNIYQNLITIIRNCRSLLLLLVLPTSDTDGECFGVSPLMAMPWSKVEKGWELDDTSPSP
jgi:hypothetical protein